MFTAFQRREFTKIEIDSKQFKFAEGDRVDKIEVGKSRAKNSRGQLEIIFLSRNRTNRSKSERETRIRYPRLALSRSRSRSNRTSRRGFFSAIFCPTDYFIAIATLPKIPARRRRPVSFIAKVQAFGAETRARHERTVS